MPKFTDFDWPEFKQRYAEQWERVVAAIAANPSHHIDWLESIISTQGLAGRVRVFAQLEGTRLTGGIPYFRDSRRISGVPMRVVETVGNLISYHQTLVCEGNRSALFAAFVEALDDWDLIHVGYLIAGGSSDHAVCEANGVSALISFPGESSPYLRLAGTFDELLAGKPKKFRYKYRRRVKDMDNAGDWEMRWFEGADADLDGFMEALLAIEESSWKVGSGMAISRRESELDYIRAVLAVLAARDALVANVLYLEGKAIAYSLCYHWGGLMGQMKTSYDSAHTALSPGTMVIDAALRRAYELAAREFDFLGDSMPHKRAWSREERQHVSHYLFGHSLRARVLGALKQWRARSRSNG